MKRLNRKMYKIGQQGNIDFNLRKEIARDHGTGDSGWEHPIVSAVIMLVCGLLDFVMFKQLFGAILWDSVVLQMLSIIALLIGFDLAPVYAGIVIKKIQQGFKGKRYIATMMGVAFIIAFVGNLLLRLETKDIIMPDTSAISSYSMGTTTSTESSLPLLYACFASVMPLITSLVSFGVSLHSSNPLRGRLVKLEKEQVKLEDDIEEIESILEEYDADEDYMKRLIEDDDEKYNKVLEMVRERGMMYCDYVRERIKEHLGNPVSTNQLSMDNREYLRGLLDGGQKREAS